MPLPPYLFPIRVWGGVTDFLGCHVWWDHHMLWIGILVHHYTVMPLQIGVDFWRIGGGEIACKLQPHPCKLFELIGGTPHTRKSKVKCCSHKECAWFPPNCKLEFALVAHGTMVQPQRMHKGSPERETLPSFLHHQTCWCRIHGVGRFPGSQQGYKWCQGALVEAPNPRGMVSISTPYMYKVF